MKVTNVKGNVNASVNGKSVHIGRQRKVTIVMFSGGIDSTYTLLKLLRETNDQLLVHHIHFVNVENRYRIEAERARNIVNFFQSKYRPFGYTESSIDHRAFNFFGFDMVSVGFEAGILAHSYFLSHGRMPDRWAVGHCLDEDRNPNRLQHVLACVAANCFPEIAPDYFAFPAIAKKDEIAYLPAEVVQMAWTCRRPVWCGDHASECGECKTCLLMADVRRDTSSRSNCPAANNDGEDPHLV